MVTINWKTGGTRPEANGVDGDDNIDDNDEVMRMSMMMMRTSDTVIISSLLNGPIQGCYSL